MTGKNTLSIGKIFSIILFFGSISLFIYQIYLIEKLKKEVNGIQEMRLYYIQFLNAVSEHLKKKILN